MTETAQSDVTSLAVTLLSAYVSNNVVASNELAGLIESTKRALVSEVAPAEPTMREFAPATTVRKSLASAEHIISMIDGKPYKMLKRHLATHGLTPAEYRARYNLPADYPLVARTYSEARRKVAKLLGLGGKAAAKTKASAKPADKPGTPTEEKATSKPALTKIKTVAKAAKPAAATRVTAKAAPKTAATPKAVSSTPKAAGARLKATPKAGSKAATSAAGQTSTNAIGNVAAPKVRKKLSIAIAQSGTDTPKSA